MTTEQTDTKSLDLEHLLRVLQALRDGDLSQRMPTGHSELAGEIAATLNATLDQLNVFASEVNRIAREIGTEGKFGGQAQVQGVAGTWKDLTDNVNFMGAILTHQIREMARVTHGLARGDSPRKAWVAAQGEMLELKECVNALVDRLNSR